MAATDTTTGTASGSAATAAPVPKRITNAQTVCNEKNEKGKLCNGHLKQLRTAGEAAEIHLRGDDVLFKCQTCGTFYMGPPLGHVRDPHKQVRFVEAELSALLQAAGGTLPVVKRDERGVFIMLETGAEESHAPKPVPARVTTATTAPAAAVPAPSPKAAATPVTPKSTEHKAGAQPNRQLFKRSTYAGVTDTGPVAGETFAQKVARLQALSAAAKQRADEGGDMTAASVVQESPAAPTVDAAVEIPAATQQQATPPATAEPAAPAHKATGNADRSLMKRSTYCGVVDTGPVAGETFAQKVARLTALAAAAKQRADGG